MKKDFSTILIVDDTETNIDTLTHLLYQFDVIVAMDGKSALEIIETEEIDLILLDIMMPEMTGYEVCESLKSKVKTKDIPIIFITAKDDEDSIEKAYSIGGAEYVTKPFKPRELIVRVKTQLKIRSLIKHLKMIASYDEMTGIYNRRKFFELGEDMFMHNKENMYAVMIDIDKFKLINDTYGHPTGDQVIRLVAQTIDKAIDTRSIFGRLGGEEFAILCTNKTLETVIANTEKLRKIIENLEVISDDGDIIKFTISIGAIGIKEEIKNLDNLLKEADIALYQAKNKGRNLAIFRA